MLARLRADGPLNSTQLGGAKAGGLWWDWSDTKIAVEWGQAADAEQVREARRANPGDTAVLVTHNETSTGVTSRIRDLRRAMNAVGHPALLLVERSL